MSSHRQLHWWSSLLENTHYLSMSISNILEIRIPLKVLKYNILGYVKIRQDIVCTCIWLCVCAKSLQSCLIICNPLDYTPPGSFVHGILQARTLEWVAIPFSGASSLPRDQIFNSYISCIGRQVNTNLLRSCCERGHPSSRLSAWNLLLHEHYIMQVHGLHIANWWVKSEPYK